MSTCLPYRLSIILPALFVLLAARPHSAEAQSLHGSLVGDLSDSSGGALARARIRIVSAATNDARETVSNSSGGYSFTNLEASKYTVTVSAPGFQSFQNTNVAISIDSVVRLDVTLQVGSSNEQVTVSAAAGGLQTDRSEVRHEIGEESLNLKTAVSRRHRQSG